MVWQSRHETFSRTVWMTFHDLGTTSRVSVTSSPSFDRREPPQAGHAHGAGMTTRSRGRCAGNGFLTGRLRSNGATLVVLAAAISAARSSSLASASRSSTEASQDAVAVQRNLDLETATETVAADLLINGARSQWWRLPGHGTIPIGSSEIDVTVTSEDGRLDLNTADPSVIQDALQGLGFATEDAQAFLAALLARRAQGRLSSGADIDSLVGVLVGSYDQRKRCLQATSDRLVQGMS